VLLLCFLIKADSQWYINGIFYTMKKSLTICFLCIAVVATNAQYRKDMGKSSVVPLVKVKNTSVQKSVSNLNAKKIYLLQEGFEAGMIPADWTVIDGDGDGWSYDVFDFRPHTGLWNVSSSSWDMFVGALTPDDWLITPQLKLGNNAKLLWYDAAQDMDAPGDKYSVYISTTGKEMADFKDSLFTNIVNDTIYAKREVDLATYAGQKVYIAFRHYDCTDAFMMNLDDIEVTCDPYTAPTILTKPSALNFFAEIGTSEGTSVQVNGFALTEVITVTATSPFSVSADSVTFGTTVSLPTEGGKLYIKYTPTVGGRQTAVVSVSSKDAETVSIAVTGKAADCSGTKRAPWVENFPDSTSSFYCWSIFDVNNDGVTLDFYYTDEAYTDLVAVYSFSEENAANDWLVSPALEITENNTLTFNYYVQEEYYPEKFSVYVIKDNPANYAQGTQVMATKTVSDTIATPVKIDLSAYNGQTIYIGIKVESAADSYNLYFDNFALTKTTGLKAANVTDMSVYPNPVVAGEDIYVSGVLDAVALNGMRLEVFNSLGQLVQTVKPTTSDITIRGIEQSGAYVVRIIDGNGKIMNSRFIVK
jgi:hypothetical protein